MTTITELWRIQNSFNIVNNEIRQNADFNPQIAALRFTDTFSKARMNIDPYPLTPAQSGQSRTYDQEISDMEFRIERENVIEQQNSLDSKPKAFFGFKASFEIKEKIMKKIGEIILLLEKIK